MLKKFIKHHGLQVGEFYELDCESTSHQYDTPERILFFNEKGLRMPQESLCIGKGAMTRYYPMLYLGIQAKKRNWLFPQTNQPDIKVLYLTFLRKQICFVNALHAKKFVRSFY